MNRERVHGVGETGLRFAGAEQTQRRLDRRRFAEQDIARFGRPILPQFDACFVKKHLGGVIHAVGLGVDDFADADLDEAFGALKAGTGVAVKGCGGRGVDGKSTFHSENQKGRKEDTCQIRGCGCGCR